MNQAPSTPLRARISKGFRYRLLAIGLGVFVFGLLAVYDGEVKYPRQAAIYAELQQMQEEHEDWASRWVTYAEERGYETNPNEVKGREAKDSWTQRVMAAICLPVGAWFLFCWFRAGGRFVEADDTGIRSRDGAASWAEVTDLDDSRWRTKGIAKVVFGGAGSEGGVLLDDWKFEREPTVAIHDLVMAKLGRTPEGGASGPDGTPAPDPDPDPDPDPASNPEVGAAGPAEPIASAGPAGPEADQPLRP